MSEQTLNENPYSITTQETPSSDGLSPSAEQRSTPNPPSWPVQFDGQFSQTWTVVVPLLVGGLAIGAGLLMFAAHLWLLDATNQWTLHMTSTAPTIFGVFSIIRGVGGRTAPRHVRLWPQGIEIQRAQMETIAWSAITAVRVSDSSSPGTPHEKVMVLSGVDGEPIGRITGKLAKNPRLLQCVEQMIALASPPAQNSESSARLPLVSMAARKKGRRMAVLTGVGGGLLAMAGIFLPLSAYWDYQASQSLAVQGVPGEGWVTEKFVAPNGRTLRLRYRVSDANGEVADHNVEVTESLFNEVEEGGSVLITTVPGSPELSELQRGQIVSQDPTDNPIVTGLLGAFGIVASCFMLPITVLMWKGYDVNFNDWKFKIVPMA